MQTLHVLALLVLVVLLIAYVAWFDVRPVLKRLSDRRASLLELESLGMVVDQQPRRELRCAASELVSQTRSRVGPAGVRWIAVGRFDRWQITAFEHVRYEFLARELKYATFVVADYVPGSRHGTGAIRQMVEGVMSSAMMSKGGDAIALPVAMQNPGSATLHDNRLIISTHGSPINGEMPELIRRGVRLLQFLEE